MALLLSTTRYELIVVSFLLGGSMRSAKASICGHKTKLKGEVNAFGSTTTTEMDFPDGPEYCLDCLGKMAIQCAWCGKAIFIGDPITLKVPNESFEVPEFAVKYREDPLVLVGCLRGSCTSTIAERAGFWVPALADQGQGHVQPTGSIFAAAMSGGAAVKDITDPREEPTVIAHD